MRNVSKLCVLLLACGSLALGQSIPTLSGTGPYTWSTTVLALTSSGISLACNDTSGSGSAQSCTTSPTVTPASGTAILYSSTTQNTGDLTVNVNSTSAIHVRKYQGSAVLAAGDLKANVPVTLTYDGTFWEIGANIGNAPSGGSGTVTSVATTAPIGGGTISTTGTLTCATCVVATVNPSAGLLRVAGSTQTTTGAELSGDATTSGSNAVTVVKVNGASVPASAAVLGSNSSSQAVAATPHQVALPLQCADTSASATTYTCTTTPSIGAYTTGDTFILTGINQNNSGSSTLNVDGIAAKTIKKWQNTANLAAGDLQASGSALLTYDGTFLELDTIGNAPGGSGTVTSVATTSPITGGTFTTSGTVACATCVVATVNPSAGLLRVAGSTQTTTGAELSGDATTSGSNAVTVVKVNGGSVPVSATVLGSNGSSQPIAAALTTGQVWNGASNLPSGTATPTLGASGTLGSLTFGNATSGLLTLEPTTGAITSYTIALPVAQPTGGNTFLSCTAASPAVCTWAAGGGTPAYPLAITGGVSGGIVYGNDATHLTVSAAGTVNTLVKWGGAGAAPAASSTTDNGTTLLTTEPFATSYAGTASQASLGATGAPYTGGTATTNFPLGYLNAGAGPTSFSTHGTMWGINAPSGFTGDFEYFCVNGTPAVGACPIEMNYQGNLIVTQTAGTQFALNLQNVTAATLSTAQSSPYDIRSGTAWYNPEFDTVSPPVAAASAQDCWSHQVLETNGSNGASIYNLVHNNAIDTCVGVPSASYVQVPYQVSFGVSTNTIAQASAPTVAAQGTTGATNWSYAIVACVGPECSQQSTATQITNGNATLGTSTIWNKVTWAAVTNADFYKVYRTQAGGTPSTTGAICLIPAGGTLECDDKALTADGTTGQAFNATGQVYVGTGPVVGGGSGGGMFGTQGTIPTANASTSDGWYANSVDGLLHIVNGVTSGTTPNDWGYLTGVVGKTSQKSETTTADANVLTVTPPSVAGTYRINVAISVSSATSGVIGWTATWKDSNGNAQTPVELTLFQNGTAAPALTYTTSAASNYHGDAIVDVDNSGTGIVVKWIGGGTTAAKMTAIIEKLN